MLKFIGLIFQLYTDWKTFLLPPFSNSSSEDVIFQSSAVIGCVPTDPTADVMLYRKNKTNQFFEVIGHTNFKTACTLLGFDIVL